MTEDMFWNDLEAISGVAFIDWAILRKSRILITGATGLIGYALTTALMHVNREKNLEMRISVLVRDLERARERFSDASDRFEAELEYIVGDITRIPDIEGSVDYIIHGASPTASMFFVKSPVETIETAVWGTKCVLELAREKKVKGMVYMSSMEVYGHPQRGKKVPESDAGRMETSDVRNSYPISKLMCESMCCAYASEYAVPVSGIRLAQTFGTSASDTDSRVFAEFYKCVREGRDIVLKTRGETERSYLDVIDAVTAIILILIRGERGVAYNAANELTYCSIAEMAQRVAAQGGVNVRFEIQPEQANGYPQPVYMDLDTSRLKALGWFPVSRRYVRE